MTEPKYNGKELDHIKAYYICQNEDDSVIEEILTSARIELMNRIKKTVYDNKVVYELDMWVENNDQRTDVFIRL